MWLMTKGGFYSIVEKQPGVYHVRARELADLTALTADDGPLPGERIHAYTGTDYEYRLIVNKVAVQRLFAFLLDGLDYANFKAEAGRHPDQQGKPYHRIWEIIRRAAGGPVQARLT